MKVLILCWRRDSKLKKLLSARNITKVYKVNNDDFYALKNINIEIDEPLISIVGRSGSGKSTLLNILGGLDTPSNGTIEIEGESLFSLSENERTMVRRNKIGFIFQSYNLIPVLNVKENIELPITSKDKGYVDELMNLLNIYDKRNMLPNEISGGQQQRVAIARALINKPKIVLADEPTGNLDSKNEHDVLELFHKIVGTYNTTFIIVTHNQEVAKITDRTIHLEDGEII
ncbi:MAG: ABC-type transport system, ATP-binding protein [Clostridiaceae bacterium]|jgi:putative ABC transport system ATP-binding protein|nr:ABC-type transport system, ATP-binding protein [Clostridiaceae bacterium]